MRGMKRSIQLFKGFLHEQDDPVGFYKLLADDAINEMSRYCQLTGARVIDIGGASGYVGDAIVEAGASSLTVEYDWDQIVEHGRRLQHGVQGDGLSLPIFDVAFDVAYSSNVLEHVADPPGLIEEMIRVTKPGGLIYLSFTNWFSPWGGHEMSPYHLLGVGYAARRYARRHGRPPKHVVGENLFRVHIGPVLRHVRSRPDVQLLDALPRYYPRWCKVTLRIPWLRELLAWNALLIIRRNE